MGMYAVDHQAVFLSPLESGGLNPLRFHVIYVLLLRDFS